MTEYPYRYEVTITMILRFKEPTTKEEVKGGVEAAMWGTRMSTQEGAWLADLHFEAKEKMKK